MKTRSSASLLVLSLMAFLIIGVSCFSAFPLSALAESGNTKTMYRLYNQYSGEHFYTSTTYEVGNCVTQGWKYEGIGWTAPASSNSPVYRLYNPYTGDHHYTLSADERDQDVAAGWKYEGIGWYSDDAKTSPVYREYNPYATTGTHNYTGQRSEHDHLISVGWRGEGVGWYAASVPTKAQDLQDNSDKTAVGEGLNVNSSSVCVYRMYLKSTGEHLYSADLTEIGELITKGWKYEGPGWLAPKSSNTPVYRVYNPNSDDHHYTTSASERDQLVSAGWIDQGVGWYSDDAKTAVIYRDYNPNKSSHNHNYTGDKAEHQSLISQGWKSEGVGWYALALTRTVTQSNAGNIASSQNYAVVDRGARKTYLYYPDGSLARTVDVIPTGGIDLSGTHVVCRKARGYWAEPYCYDVNDWWVCFVDAVMSSPSYYNGNAVSQYVDGRGYEDGAGFHYGWAGSGCVCIPNLSEAKYVYDFLAVGSKVIVC